MKQLIILLLSMITVQGCSVYGDLTKCEGFDEAGTRCTGLISNLEYSKGRERGLIPAPEEALTLDDIDYALLDEQVKNDEFARLVLDKKIDMNETDPVLRPAKTVKATIYPYSDGSKFYQLRHIWVKTNEEQWIVGNSMLVDAKGTVMMDKGASINTVGSSGGLNDSKNTGTGSYSKEESGTAESQPGFYQESAQDTLKVTDSSRFKTGNIVTINVLFLNVRQEANAESTIIGVVPAGGRLRILDESDGKWQRVRAVYYPKNALKKEYDGWVHKSYLMATNPEATTWEDAL